MLNQVPNNNNLEKLHEKWEIIFDYFKEVYAKQYSNEQNEKNKKEKSISQKIKNMFR